MDTLVAPVMALAGWSLLMWVWMYVRRLPAIQKAGLDPQSAAHPGSLDILPSSVRAAADNYNHLMEQPTIFYAAALAIQVAGHGDGWALSLAWTYVALRVLHSLVQISVNRVAVRFLVFSASTIALAAMVARECVKLLA
jgi:hypothetical protein